MLRCRVEPTEINLTELLRIPQTAWPLLDVLQKVNLKPDDIVSFLTTPKPSLLRLNPAQHGAASELWATLLIVEADAAVSVEPTSDQPSRYWTVTNPNPTIV